MRDETATQESVVGLTLIVTNYEIFVFFTINWLYPHSLVEFSMYAVAISAAGLSNLASDPDNHWRVIKSENMLKRLLQALVLDHPLAQHHILRLLCDIVANKATQAEVVSSGVVRAVQEMGNRDIHASPISLILLNISCNSSLASRYGYFIATSVKP